MSKLYLWIISVLKFLVIFLSAAIVIVVTVQVFSRFVLQAPSSITEELSRFLLIWIGLLGGAYGYHSNAHLGLDIITNRLHGLLRYRVSIISHFIIMTFAIAVMVTGGISLVLLTFEPPQISAALEIKMGYIYSVVPISGMLIVYISLIKILELFSQISKIKKAA
jgi:TRAP-type C4-dicarboxylate transport system permease small subunit